MLQKSEIFWPSCYIQVIMWICKQKHFERNEKQYPCWYTKDQDAVFIVLDLFSPPYSSSYTNLPSSWLIGPLQKRLFASVTLTIGAYSPVSSFDRGCFFFTLTQSDATVPEHKPSETVSKSLCHVSSVTLPCLVSSPASVLCSSRQTRDPIRDKHARVAAGTRRHGCSFGSPPAVRPSPWPS